MSIQFTSHYSISRFSRENLINSVIGEGYAVIKFIVDRNHPNGNEVHTITTNGIIVVTNLRTNRVVSKLIARPSQLSRYLNGGWGVNEYRSVVLGAYTPKGVFIKTPTIPSYIFFKARHHQSMGYNKF